jgi:hypothetical protein
MIELLAQLIEKKTDKHWNKDVFTGEALRRGIEVLVSHFAPRGTPVTPINLEKEAAKIAKMCGDVWEAYRSPVGLGETEAGQVMAWIEISNFRVDLEEIGRVNADLRKNIPGISFPKEEWYLHKQMFGDLKPGGKHPREK